MGKLLQMSGVIVDLHYRVEAVPRAGEEAIVCGYNLSAGGGFNAMVAAHRAGMSVSYGGVLGVGPLAEIAATALQTAGITRLQPRASDADQGCCTVLIDAGGERTFIAKEGAEGKLSRRRLAKIGAEKFDWVLLSGYALAYTGSRDALADWLDALPTDANLIFDPCPLVAQIPADILQKALNKANWISANRKEAAFLSATQDPLSAATQLASGRAGTVVRDGAAGCLIATRASRAVHIPGFSVDVVDTSGAGDTHIGAFIAALDRGQSPAAAARYANAAAALSITQHGPATAPGLNQTHEFLAGAGVHNHEANDVPTNPTDLSHNNGAFQ